jgi:pimeloyl-ACP methyl ester carboxylesterase
VQKVDNVLSIGGKAAAGKVGLGDPASAAQAAMMLDLPIVVISSPKDRRHDDPVVYISGGPGDGDWVDAERIPYWWDYLQDNPWLRHRDLILFDQRGVGMTEPRADCPEMEALELPSLSLGNDHQRAAEEARDAARACLARLQREGHDAAAYTTAASAEDLHDIFTALGIPRWNIYGLSYGTRLALTYMRLHPADIRTAILDSVYPPQVKFLEDDAWRTDRAFRLIFEACSADADCRQWYPDLAHHLLALVERLNAKPLAARHANPDGGPDLQFPITGETLLTHLFFSLYNRDDIERIPQIIDIFDRNLAKPIAREVDQLIAELHDRPDWGDAMSTTIDCLEDVPFNDPAKVQANYAASPLLRSFADADPAPLCTTWVKAPPITAMDAPVESGLPSLVLAGFNDPVTPPSYAKLAASHLSKAFYVEFPAIGHDVLGNSDCAGRVAEAFLDQPDRQPTDPCQAKANPLVFLPPVNP